MRRGHPGIGGWRGENTRHFRPRSGGTPHFRPPRNYGLLETLRFAPPGSRFRDISPFNTRSEIGYNPSEHHDRSKYRLSNLPNNQRTERDHHGQRGKYPHTPRRHGDGPNYTQYQETRNYHENIQSEPYLINSMGDIDQRQLMTTPKPREPYSHHRIPVWDHEKMNENKRSYYDEGNQNKSYRPDLAESGKLPTSDYIGHRPPASDHYGGNPGSAIDNSNSFSRSVDDTVDLVRKRLLNRNEPQHNPGNQINAQNQEHQETRSHDPSSYPSTQEAPTKKRVQRQRQNVKKNCDKMKNKIVHQLFKMDKDKIHKLMDNPSSSTKFEYAISSLITESQNSLNRHLRSVAEKSLTTSSDFINNDNNTIYEDTFMKQMQCILDPQDTMFLEDIKPLVMQELTKVLQLDNDYEQPHENMEGQGNYYAAEDIQYENPDNFDIYNDYPYEEKNPQNYELQNPEMNTLTDYESNNQPAEPLFERRPANVQRSKSQERRFSMEQRRLSRMSADQKSTENPFSIPNASARDQHKRSVDRISYDEPASCESLPIFDTNAEHFSEDEDPFADLDKQYHVAVDHNFIQDYNVSPQPSLTSNRSKSPPPIKKEIETSIKSSSDIKKEIDTQLFNIAKSPLEIIPSINESLQTTPHKEVQVKHESNITPVKKPEETPVKSEYFITADKKPKEEKVLETNIDQGKSSQEKNLDQRGTENNSTIIKNSASGSSRKRSLDQRPSHRKEKRKKNDSSQSEPSKQILNKNIIINVNDCAAKKNEKCAEAATKSIFNLFFSKGEHSKEPAKDTNKTDSTDKNYSDKYVKRKEQPCGSKEIKQSETKKRHRSTSSSHSIVSPKPNNSTSSNSSSSQPLKSDKSESKTKLKHIDMFTEQSRKISMHQSNRNTAIPPKTPDKIPEENKSKQPTVFKMKKSPTIAKKLVTKETQTFESKRSTSRFCQTDKKKLAVKATQTDPVTPEKSGPKSTDTFERMKEIDLEIQVLLQEKFKLYSSLESKDTNQTLGMTVLNVGSYEEDKEQPANLSESEDAIVADFTSIPVEELEQIALETVEDDAFETPRIKKNLRQKIIAPERTSSRSPKLKKNSKKGKGPNISLIEQIITDDRPLEEIISLDDLECSPMKSKKKSVKQVAKSKKKNSKKKGKQTKPIYDTTTIIPDGLQLKECCVVLRRDDIENYFKNKSQSFVKQDDEPAVIVETIPVFADSEIESMYSVPERVETIQETVVNDDSVNVNDIHFDMLDVSEDIVIGDVYDAKSNEKDVGQRLDISVSEEVILDNSQSSMEEVTQAETMQPDSQCKMYDFSTDENLRRDAYIVTSNPDAVLALECVENNNFLAACLDGNVYHYNSDGQLITTLRGYNQPVTCLNIVKEKYGTTVYTGSLDSRIRYYDLESGMEKGPECNVLSPIQSMDRAWDTVFVGTRTGFVLQFECKNNMLIPVSTVKFSEQSILALRAIKEGPRKVLLVAARSEDVTIKDAQTGLLLRTLSGPKMTVYSLLFEDGKVYCGTSSHQIHVFDYASSSHLATHEGGKGVVCLRASGGLLFAGCYDGCVYVYRESEPRPLAQLRGPGVMLLSLAIVGSKIIAGYKDRGLHIWKIPLAILQEMIL